MTKQQITCPACTGTGSTTKTCGTCNGNGCKICNQTGRITIDCDRCNGWGTIHNP